MKTVSIGDTHGIAIVNLVSKLINEFDKVIFVGDYVDSFDVDNLTMEKNLLDIIELKKKYSEKIILLWGNHDIQYLLGDQYLCPGYRFEMKLDFYEIFCANVKLFQFSYQINNYLWTHAGVHNDWFEKRFSLCLGNHENLCSYAESLNMAFEERFMPMFDVGYKRGGLHKFGGPLWCDRTELLTNPLKIVNQIVGHSRVKNIQKVRKADMEIAFIDILENEEIVNLSSFFYKEI